MNTTSSSPTRPFVTSADQLARVEQIAGAVRFSNFTTEKVRWLWPDRIPLGRITLLVSDPGLGKSLLALDIAARISTGRPWPDQEQGAGSTEQGVQHSNPQSEIENPQSPRTKPATLNPHHSPAPRSSLPAPCFSSPPKTTSPTRSARGSNRSAPTSTASLVS